MRKIEEKKKRDEEQKKEQHDKAMNDHVNIDLNEDGNGSQESEIGDAFNPDSRLGRHNQQDSDLDDPDFGDSSSSQEEQARIRAANNESSSDSSSDSDSMFEYELDSQHGQNEERKNFDYDFSKEEFLNPIVVKGPDGTVSVGTESKDKNSKEALCWNCQTHLIYRMGAKKVRCFKCSEVNDMNINNKDAKTIIKCQNQEC